MSNSSQRKSDHPIDPMFLGRWSPRAFQEETISKAELMSILEAARWAPSSFNLQPWRFIYARRETAHWMPLLDLLVPFNRDWARHASALVFLVTKTTMVAVGSGEQVPSSTHALDAGAASAHMALQAHLMGWSVHGMAGFDRDRAPTILNLPPDLEVQAVYAIGRQGDPATLPEKLRSREQPSSRMPLSEIAFEGSL